MFCKNKTIRRFYKDVTLKKTDGGFLVWLDGKTIRTPMRNELLIPSKALAKAVADEWRMQEENINPVSMPFTQIMTTAIDIVIPAPEQIGENLLNFADTDLLCYRAEESDVFKRELAKLQNEKWQPVLDWFEHKFGAVFIVTSGILPVEQSEKTVKIMQETIKRYKPVELAALYLVSAVFCSVVLGVALMEGHLDADEAFTISQLDEIYQSEKWGEDSEALERQNAMRDEVRNTATFVKLLGS
ncbi:MAG: ATPase [Alphaproteobacteria bacterium]|nr:ATPase [Alphaproteobacteria bacterium]